MSARTIPTQAYFVFLLVEINWKATLMIFAPASPDSDIEWMVLVVGSISCFYAIQIERGRASCP